MNKSKYKVYNGKNIKEKIRNYKNYIFLFLLCSGLIIGAFSAGKSELMKNVAVKFLEFRKGSGFSELFLKSSLINLIFILSSVFLGFSIIGTPEIYCLVFIRGLGTGALCGFLYNEYELSGVCYVALTMLPSLLISVYSLIMSCRDSSEYSINAYYKAIKGRGQYSPGETKVYIARQVIYIIIAVFGSLIDSLFAILFSKLISI